MKKISTSFTTTPEQFNRIKMLSSKYQVSQGQMLRFIIQRGMTGLFEQTEDQRIAVSMVDHLLAMVPGDSDEDVESMEAREQKIMAAVEALRA